MRKVEEEVIEMEKFLIISKEEIRQIRFDRGGWAWVKIHKNKAQTKENEKRLGFELWVLEFPIEQKFIEK